MGALLIITLSYYKVMGNSVFILFLTFPFGNFKYHRQFWHGIMLECVPPQSLGRDAVSRHLFQAVSGPQQKPILPTDFQESQGNQREFLLDHIQFSSPAAYEC